MTEIIDLLKKYTNGKQNTDKVEISVIQLNRIIKALEQEPKWIPVKWHSITEEEREREGYPKDWLTILDCQMPNDGEEVLVTVKGKNGNLYVETDTCYFDGFCYSSDNGYDWIDDVVAWMPLPKSYKAESEG